MKLRNKKTGEIFDALIREKGGGGSYSLIVCDIKAYETSKSTLDETHFILDEYETLAELNEEWEDYNPKEPLIKDEKIRKAVRAWAEACGYDGACIVEYDKRFDELSGIAHTTVIALGEIDFDLEDRKRYTIAELCGEEEAPEPLEPTFINLDERIKEKEEG